MIKYFYIIIFLFPLFVSAQERREETKQSQNFVLENLNGEMIELYEEIGEGPILLSFWATWCKPCKEELKEYNKLYERYAERGFKLFAISVDSEKSIAKVKPYIKTNGFNFTVLLDYNSEVARMYYAQMVPYSVILNKSGEVVYTHLGYKKGDEIKVQKIIADLLDL